MTGCPMKGGWQYEQHSGHTKSLHTEMSSVPELHIYTLFGVKFWKQGEETRIRRQHGRFKKRCACFFFSFHRQCLLSIGLCFDLCFFGPSLSCFLGSRPVYVLRGLSDPMFVCTT